MKHLAVAAVAALLATSARGAPHEHGVGALQVAVDNRTLVIELRLPAKDVIGFERAPRTDAERGRIEQARAALADARLFAPSTDARCAPAGTPAVETPTFTAPSGGADEHADFEATFRFECENPAGLAALDHGVFKAFPKVKRLNVQAVSGRGQKKAVLTHGKPRFSF